MISLKSGDHPVKKLNSPKEVLVWFIYRLGPTSIAPIHAAWSLTQTTRESLGLGHTMAVSGRADL